MGFWIHNMTENIWVTPRDSHTTVKKIVEWFFSYDLKRSIYSVGYIQKNQLFQHWRLNEHAYSPKFVIWDPKLSSWIYIWNTRTHMMNFPYDASITHKAQHHMDCICKSLTSYVFLFSMHKCNAKCYHKSMQS